jgi:hypothetical protein
MSGFRCLLIICKHVVTKQLSASWSVLVVNSKAESDEVMKLSGITSHDLKVVLFYQSQELVLFRIVKINPLLSLIRSLKLFPVCRTNQQRLS